MYQYYLDNQTVDTEDPNVGMIYYRAWFDEQGNTVGYVEKFVFDTEIHPGDFAHFALDNNTDGGMFHYTASSLGYGKEEKDYSLVYRVADYVGDSTSYMIQNLGITNKQGFLNSYGHLEAVSTPISTMERTAFKSEMDEKNKEAPYFAVYPQDDVFFKPTTDDFVLVEDYGLEKQDTLDRDLMMICYGTNTIQYDIARLRSFDEAGNQVNEITRYVFEYSSDYYLPGRWFHTGHYQSDARDCFLGMNLQRDQYEVLVQVDNVVYFSRKNEQSDEATRTKEELITYFNQQGYQYYASKPIATEERRSESIPEPISTGKVDAYDYFQDFDLKLEANGPKSATVTLTHPFVKEEYIVNRIGTPQGTMEYQWDLELTRQNGNNRDFLGCASTDWYNEQIGFHTREREASLSVSDMKTDYYELTGFHSEEMSKSAKVETKDGKMVWTFHLPADSAVDFTTLTEKDIQVRMSTPYELSYRLIYSH